MRHRTTIVASVAIALIPMLPLGAQMFGDNERILRFGFAGGVIVPRTGETLRSFRTGVTGQGFLLLQLPGGLPAIRLNADYAKMDLIRRSPGGPATERSSTPSRVSRSIFFRVRSAPMSSGASARST